MPIYAYRCADCGHQFDALQRLADPVLTDCPSCGKSALAKLVTAAGFQLKGSGWYQTDFRNTAKPAAAGAKPADAKAGDTKAPDAKPADSSGSSDASGGSSDAKPAASAAASCSPGCGCH